ncbi:ATP adenylyltransferase [Crocosphaera subtropica ATCC 51142]|uniref:ATP adenylyltransferase n=1 Tax=Crocosphaera subtropica (strain ATCC 51142 / BH68) TaxID=43989 RepID=B1WTK9_CROS5|nr:phosphorylase [Crocosphaera subtropica]ACB53724.1 ATP adenylyltransferase [Crocosphaera subtropica ATCC 51142]
MNKIANILLPSNRLLQKIKEQTEYALNCGALKSIPTEYELIRDKEIDFLVRIVTNLGRKDKAKKKQKKLGKAFNPFLPYEKALFVADILDTHVCLLNKFNVVDYHLLIITRDFEEQETLLTLNDFVALCACLLQVDGLGFYNNGEIAGASQRHKHLQLVPFPLVPELSKTPIDNIIETAKYQDNIGQLPCFNFVHGIVNIQLQDNNNILELAQQTLESYHYLLKCLKISINQKGKPEPYNLLVTREWMMMIPRSQPKYESISINSLGFAGALLVKNEQQMELLREVKPLTILEKVANSLMNN